MSQEIEIFYIGKKNAKRDTVAGTKLVWRGHGSSMLVSRVAAQQLLNFPTVWVDKAAFEEQFGNQATDEPQAGLSDLQASAPPEPSPTNLLTLVQEAIRRLDRSNSDHFGSTGAPKIDAVRSELPEGFELDAKILNQAFSEIKGEFRD